jgi:ABC-type protease/lipase transport system fused ATPase/permease subunit
MGSKGIADARFERWVQRLALLLGVPTLLVLFAAALFAIGDAVLAPTPTPYRPGFVDTVLGSRAVVAAIRLAIIFAGVFVVVSVVALIARGQWLIKVGPVEVSERVSDIGSENRRLERLLEKSDETVDSVRHAAGEVDNLLDRMNQEPEGVE